MRTKYVLLDATNLRVGGGVQVAASLIDNLVGELSESPQNATSMHIRIAVSPVVAENLSADFSLPCADIRVCATKPDLISLGCGYDLHWVVFGPLWGPIRGSQLLMGYADVTAVAKRYRVGLRARVRSPLSRWSLSRAETVVVETRGFAELVRPFARRQANIRVISNTYHEIFDTPAEWSTVSLPPRRNGSIRLAYVTRNYPHKNMKILPNIAKAARDRHGIDVDFVVTLNAGEWVNMSRDFNAACINVGPLRIQQVPSVYQQADGVIFPSQLEAFSASPLEALKMERPLIASNRAFVRDICSDAAEYADPDHPEQFADAIARVFSDRGLQGRLRARGRNVLGTLPSAKQRARQYLALCEDLVGDDRAR